MKVITFDEFKETYKPTIVSQVTPEYDNLMLPKADFNNILGTTENSNLTLRTLWSLVQEDRLIDHVEYRFITDTYIISGFCINAKGYFITEVPWEQEKIKVPITK